MEERDDAEMFKESGNYAFNAVWSLAAHALPATSACGLPVSQRSSCCRIARRGTGKQQSRIIQKLSKPAQAGVSSTATEATPSARRAGHFGHPCKILFRSTSVIVCSNPCGPSTMRAASRLAHTPVNRFQQALEDAERCVAADGRCVICAHVLCKPMSQRACSTRGSSRGPAGRRPRRPFPTRLAVSGGGRDSTVLAKRICDSGDTRMRTRCAHRTSPP